MPIQVWECDYCPETFAYEEDAEDHEDAEHGLAPDYYDDPCGDPACPECT